MAILQSLKDNWEHYREQVKVFIFGENNQRLDKIINYYYSWREDKRTKIRKYGILFGLVIFITSLGFYFYGLYLSQRNLQNALNAYVDIQEFKPTFTLLQKEYDNVSKELVLANQTSNLIPAIQNLAGQMNIQVASFSDDSPIVRNVISKPIIAAEFQKARVEFQVRSISVKRLASFLNEVHKLPNKFILTRLEIKGIDDKKLYFDAKITEEAYVPKSSVKSSKREQKE